jgi:hypothetical protein
LQRGLRDYRLSDVIQQLEGDVAFARAIAVIAPDGPAAGVSGYFERATLEYPLGELDGLFKELVDAGALANPWKQPAEAAGEAGTAEAGKAEAEGAGEVEPPAKRSKQAI